MEREKSHRCVDKKTKRVGTLHPKKPITRKPSETAFRQPFEVLPRSLCGLTRSQSKTRKAPRIKVFPSAVVEMAELVGAVEVDEAVVDDDDDEDVAVIDWKSALSLSASPLVMTTPTPLKTPDSVSGLYSQTKSTGKDKRVKLRYTSKEKRATSQLKRFLD